MHDNVINNAFFAVLAVGAGYAGLQACSQLFFAPQAVEAGTTFGRFASMALLGA